MLTQFIKPLEENQFVFLTPETFEIIKQVLPHFQEIQKVMYKIDKQLKVEIYNPIFSVLFMDNSDLID